MRVYLILFFALCAAPAAWALTEFDILAAETALETLLPADDALPADAAYAAALVALLDGRYADAATALERLRREHPECRADRALRYLEAARRGAAGTPGGTDALRDTRLALARFGAAQDRLHAGLAAAASAVAATEALRSFAAELREARDNGRAVALRLGDGQLAAMFGRYKGVAEKWADQAAKRFTDVLVAAYQKFKDDKGFSEALMVAGKALK